MEAAIGWVLGFQSELSRSPTEGSRGGSRIFFLSFSSVGYILVLFSTV